MERRGPGQEERPGAVTVYQMKGLFKTISNKPGLFDIDANGDFIIKNKAGDVVKTIPVGPYRKPTIEEVKTMEDSRAAAIAAADEAYEVAIEALRDGTEQYKLGQIPKTAIMRLNLAVESADRGRGAAMYGLRETVERKGYEVREILYDQRYEVRKMPHLVYRGLTRAHKLQDEYVRYGHAEEAEVAAEAEVAVAASAPVMSVMKDVGMIIFGGADENEYGYLASDFPAEFTIGPVRYFTVDQTLAAEKARTYMADEVRTKIMKSRATKMMRVYADMLDKKPVTDGLEGPAVAEAALAAAAGPRPEAAEWLELRPRVLAEATFAKFKQNPALADKLLATGDATLVFADARNKVDGVGLGLTDGRVTSEAAWKGENQLGKVLMNVRTRLRGATDAEAVEGVEEITEETISEEAYDEKLKNAAKLGAIIASRRSRQQGAN
jgi:ribA/ribD-fused uncharacterized protein